MGKKFPVKLPGAVAFVSAYMNVIFEVLMIENAILIGLSKQVALQRKIDVIANNMANINSAGFKRDSILFEEYLMPVARMTEMKGQDRVLSYVNDTAMYRNYSEGPMVKTDDPLDVAIKGDGWLVVQTKDGDRYTRNGHMKLNNEGVLVTSNGDPVLGEAGPITIPRGETNITIAVDGLVSTNRGDKDKLMIVTFKDQGKLKKDGEMLMKSDERPGLTTNARVLQGMIERSNVEPVVQLTEMIQATREYVTNSKILQQHQELRQSAIQQLGRSQQ